MNSVQNPVTGKEMKYKEITKHSVLITLCKIVLGNELGRLLQGIRYTKVTNTCFFIDLVDIPKYQKFTYGKLVCNLKPHKAEK